MEEQELTAYITIIFGILFIIPFILFFVTEQRLIKLIRPENRFLEPGNVWLQLIPLFGAVYQFTVVRKIAASIHAELTQPIDDSIFGQEENIPEYPAYKIGITYCILFCCTIIPIPIVKNIASLAGLGFWIWYWVELSRYRRKILIRLTPS